MLLFELASAMGWAWLTFILITVFFFFITVLEQGNSLDFFLSVFLGQRSNYAKVGVSNRMALLAGHV